MDAWLKGAGMSLKGFSFYLSALVCVRVYVHDGYVCLYVCVCVCACLHICLSVSDLFFVNCIDAFVGNNVHVRLWQCLYVHVCECVWVWCVYVCVFVCVHCVLCKPYVDFLNKV